MSKSRSLFQLSILFFSLFIFSNVYGQTDSLENSASADTLENITPKKKRESYILLGMTTTISTTSKDEAFSPLAYTGFGLGVSGGFLTRGEKFDFLIDGSFNFGLMRTDLAGSSDGGGNIFYSVPVHMHGLWNIYSAFKNTEGAYFKAGWAIDFQGNYRGNFSYTNSALNFEYITGVGPGTQLGWDVHLKKTGKFFRKRDRDLSFMWTFSFPIFGSYMRPSYNTISNFTTGDSFISGEGKQNFAFIGEIYQFDSRLEMFYQLHNTNAFRLMYEWKYFAVNEGSSGTTHGAFHQLSLAFMFNVSGTK